MNLRPFAVEFWRLGALGQPENGDLDRKWTQMDANGGWEQPGKGIFGRKTGKGARKQEGGRLKTTKIAKIAKNGLKIDQKW